MKIAASDDVSTIIAMFGSELIDSTKPFGLLVRFRVNEGQQRRVEDAFAQAIPSTLQEPGVISFFLHRETKDPTRFAVYERWKTLADLEAHLRMPYITVLRRCLDELITDSPEFHVLLPAC